MIEATSMQTYLRDLRKDAKRIAFVTTVCVAAAVAYAFLAPQWYETQISVVPGTPSKQPSGLAAAAMAWDLPIDLNSGGDADRIQAVLRSRSVTDAVLEKFDLVRLYGKRHIEDARRVLWKHCSTRLEKKPSVVFLSCEAMTPVLAQAMTEYFGEVGNAVFRRVSTSSAGEERRFLEKRVADAKKEVTATSERLRQFQEQHRIIDLGEQSKAVVSAIASLKGEALSKQIELSYIDSFSAEDEATASQLREQLAIMERQMKVLEEKRPANGGVQKQSTANNANMHRSDGNDEMFPPAMEVPRLRSELEELYRAEKVQETLFMLLTQRFEMAKVNEARDTSAFQILDHADLPTKTSRPNRAFAIALAFVIGLGASVGWTIYQTNRRQFVASTPASHVPTETT